MRLYNGSWYKLLHDVDLFWITGRSVHLKADIEKQKSSKKNFSEKVPEVIAQCTEIKNVDVWFQTSPELNPIEQIWQQLRHNWLSNCCYDGYEAIVDACCDAWNWFIDAPCCMVQLCTRTWALL